MAENGVTLNGVTVSGGKTVDTETSPVSGFEMQRVKLVTGAVGADAGDLTLGQAAKAASLSIVPASNLSNLEPAGAAITGATMPSGGVGLTGWLSAIWKALTATISTQAANPSAIIATRFTPGLGSSGVGTAVSTGQAIVNGVVIKALKANTGTVWIGPSGVTDESGGAPGYPLVAGEAVSYAVQNLSAVYAIADNMTDAVAITGN
jgi:hypothetical protein